MDRYEIAGAQKPYLNADEEVIRVDYSIEACEGEEVTKLCISPQWVEWLRIEQGGDPDYATAFPTRTPTRAPVVTPMPTWPDDIVRVFTSETCTSSLTGSPSVAPTRTPSVLAPLCADRGVFDVGYGGCDSYDADSGSNFGRCYDDCMLVRNQDG